ncbi:hypothetical protein QBC46DRAFT_27861 [Diplogelasinospora grovesii]|uniref:Uncharacterized protein n=1 Tax=Diplogelasinospora grovesii TaxID=303347 RepID=A0AAN6S7T9_9PEZI|nr:hypothetical protein QBC46DRAFT_27861 [Diplogelasinospora grovesii]
MASKREPSPRNRQRERALERSSLPVGQGSIGSIFFGKSGTFALFVRNCTVFPSISEPLIFHISKCASCTLVEQLDCLERWAGVKLRKVYTRRHVERGLVKICVSWNLPRLYLVIQQRFCVVVVLSIFTFRFTISFLVLCLFFVSLNKVQHFDSLLDVVELTPSHISHEGKPLLPDSQTVGGGPFHFQIHHHSQSTTSFSRIPTTVGVRTVRPAARSYQILPLSPTVTVRFIYDPYVMTIR